MTRIPASGCSVDVVDVPTSSGTGPPPGAGRRRGPEAAGSAEECLHGTAQLGGEPLGVLEEVGQVQVDLETLADHQVGEILGGDVAGRSRCEGAAPEAADRGIERDPVPG